MGAPRKPAPLVAALAVALCCALAVQATRAPAQSLEQRLGEQQARLERAEERRQGVAAQVEGLNAEVDALLGEVSALQLERDAVRDRLAAKQAQLDRATAALERQRRRLEAARERLRRSLVVLRRRLVAIYKAGTPDTLGIVLGSQTWSEAVAQAAYLRQVQEHDDAMVARVRALRDEAREGVRRMGAIRDRLRAARDAIAVEERQLARTQATLSGRFAELRAAQAQRQELLATLGARVGELRGEVSSLNERLEAQQADPAAAYAPAPPPVPGSAAELLPSGLAAAPADAPAAVVAVIEAANRIAHTPYLWGGGHGSFDSPGYDCSGAVSYALGGGGFLDSPLDSTGLSFWGEPGSGSWITVYANSGHAYAVIAGLRWDTSGGAGPRWHSDMRSGAGYVARHPAGY